MRSIRLTKLAVLDGEDMLQFRSGQTLYAYCPGCSNSAMTPISKTLGCTIGDDPDVLDFSRRLEQGETNEETEKCPGFDSDALAEGATAPHEAAKAEAVMVKEIPAAEPVESIKRRPTKAGLTVPVSESSDLNALYGYLDQIGVLALDRGQQSDAVLEALVSWEGGLMAAQVTPTMVTETLTDYLNSRKED